MKPFWKETAAALILTILVPGLLFNTGRLLSAGHPTESTQPAVTGKAETEPPDQITIRVQAEDGTVIPMELEAYLVGVVSAEMPAAFETEALKAQAVVARTYTLRRVGSNSKHPDADICMNPECCQGYKAEQEYAETQRIREAVASTAGLVLTYNGELIEATYFSSSGGRTEDALAVWGSDIPYLRATDSPEEDYADRYLETVTVTGEEFASALGISPEGPCSGWLGEVTYTNGGGIDTMVIADQVFRGTELRKLLGLRSTAFLMTAVGDHITITTRGYGHRVGMSQYGAEAMAVDGATFQEILSHYYQGTTLAEFVDKDSGIG